MTASVYRMEFLDKTHGRDRFLCEEEALDRYLKEQASQDMKRHCSTVIVAVKPDEKAVLGFYSISSAIVRLDALPEAERKRLPRYEHIPAVLLGRLAVAKEEKGQGLGAILLADAVTRACRSDIAWAVFIVKAKHEQAAGFYRHFGFTPFGGEPLILWNTRKSIERTIAG